MTPQCIVLISGANRGIGYETAKALLLSTRSYKVLLGSRCLANAELAMRQLHEQVPASTSTMEPIQLDLCDDESIAAVASKVRTTYGRLDVLVNNAGALLDYNLRDKSMLRSMFNESFNINVTGPHVLTHNLAPLLLRSSDPRLLFVTSSLSTLGSLRDSATPKRAVFAKGWPKLPSSPAPAPISYRTSKSALNMLMLNWYWIFKEDGVKVWAISPGLLATGLGGDPTKLRDMGARDPAIGGVLLQQVIEGERDSEVGHVLTCTGVQPW